MSKGSECGRVIIKTKTHWKRIQRCQTKVIHHESSMVNDDPCCRGQQLRLVDLDKQLIVGRYLPLPRRRVIQPSRARIHRFLEESREVFAEARIHCEWWGCEGGEEEGGGQAGI